MSENPILLVASVVSGLMSSNKHVEGHFGWWHHGGRVEADWVETTGTECVKESPGVEYVNS